MAQKVTLQTRADRALRKTLDLFKLNTGVVLGTVYNTTPVQEYIKTRMNNYNHIHVSDTLDE